MDTRKTGISFSVIGFAALLMAVTAPTLEKYHAITVTQVGRKLVSKILLAKLRNILLGK